MLQLSAQAAHLLPELSEDFFVEDKPLHKVGR